MRCETTSFSIAKLSIEREAIIISPEYQREAGAWGREKQELFLDTLFVFNGCALPKLHFCHIKTRGNGHYYALVDGLQRLQCIWDFVDGKIPLGDDFEMETDNRLHLANKPLPAAGNSFNDLSEYWQAQFKGIILSVAVIYDAELEDIEEIFARLDNGVAGKVRQRLSCSPRRIGELIGAKTA